jgi:hypothetical protein
MGVHPPRSPQKGVICSNTLPIFGKTTQLLPIITNVYARVAKLYAPELAAYAHRNIRITRAFTKKRLPYGIRAFTN